MAKPWAQVAASPQYQSLPPEKQEAARRQYFDQVVVPQIGDPAKVEIARAQFDKQTASAAKPKAAPQAVPPAPAKMVMPGAPRALGTPFTPSSGPSLEQTNASNREMMADPERMAAYEANIRQADQASFGRENPILKGIAGAGSVIPKTAMGLGQVFGITDEADAQGQRDRMAFMDGDTAASVGKVAGDVAMFAVPASRLGMLQGASRYAGAAGMGAGAAFVQPTVEGESRVANTATGAALGTAGQFGADKLLKYADEAGRAITPELRSLYEAAKARGVGFTPAQLSDSKTLKYAESMLSKLPFSGAGKRTAEQVAQWNRALAKAIGEDADVVTPEVYARAKLRQSAQFTDLTSRNNLNVTDDLVRGLESIKEEALMAGDDAAKAVANAVDGFYRRVTNAGGKDTVPGKAYQALDSQLGKVTKLGNEASYYVGQVQRAIRGAMDDSIAPADQKAWKTLRREYGDRKTIRDLVAKGDGGEISPASLMGRTTANNAGKESMASGTRGEIGTLARIGQRIKEPGSSGTAERLGNMAVGAGAITSLPLTLAGLVAGRGVSAGLNSSALSKLMMREGRGDGLRGLAALVRAGGVAAVPAKPEKRLKDRD